MLCYLGTSVKKTSDGRLAEFLASSAISVGIQILSIPWHSAFPPLVKYQL